MSTPNISDIWRIARAHRIEPPDREAYEKMKAELTLIRYILKLNPVHCPVESVRILYEQGRKEFEKIRGAPCEYAAEWAPRQSPKG